MTDWGTYLETMRRTAPLVQNITNYVAMNVMANVMLAAGASPAMVHDAQEAGEFAGIAQALTINIGTLSPHWINGMIAAARVAHDRDIPWVLDPVAVGATALRRGACADLVALCPTVIRGNASEILALSGVDAAGKGADSADSVDAAEDAARALARQTGGIVAVTGARDFVTDGNTAFRIENGHPLMPRITVMGCSLTGIVGAFLVGQDPLLSTVAALTYYGLAGERAGEDAAGPGSFQPAFLDALYGLTRAEVKRGARVTVA